MGLTLPVDNARESVLVTTLFESVGKQLKYVTQPCEANATANNNRDTQTLAMSIREPGHKRQSFTEASLHCTKCLKALAGAK